MAWQEKYSHQQKYYERTKSWHKRMRVALRQEVIAAYGGKCVCCGESHFQFLTLDHPHGNGQEDRKKYKNMTGQIYGWAKKNGYPDIYRVLCMNCNWVRRYDVCPHELDKSANESNTTTKLISELQDTGLIK